MAMAANPPSTDLHDMRLADPQLDELCGFIQSQTAQTILSMGPSRFPGLPAKVLVTGSSGYVGAAVVMSLRALGVSTTGLDLRASPYTDVTASVADGKAVKAAVKDSGGVIHTAALHAPHDKTHSEEQYQEVNVEGTRIVLEAANCETGCRGMVHTSTTSLLITDAVKATEAAGKVRWFDEEDGHKETPRNKYGRSKQAAERLCREFAQRSGVDVGVTVLRLPRCFPEDLLEGSDLSLPNVKANELLGRRSALVDVVAAILLGLSHARATQGFTLATLCAPWPWAGGEGKEIPSSVDQGKEISSPADQGKEISSPADQGKEISSPVDQGKEISSSVELASWVREQRPEACEVYSRLGWQMPRAVSRVYDSSAAQSLLGWRPFWTFDTMVQALAGKEGVGVCKQDALLGRY